MKRAWSPAVEVAATLAAMTVRDIVGVVVLLADCRVSGV